MSERGGVAGAVAPGFERVAQAFDRIIADRPRAGAAVAIRLNGEPVVDLWGGLADGPGGRQWQADTPSVIFSGTKGVMAILAAQLVEKGMLDYESPVADYWPEFAQNGKAHVRISDILSHRAGLPTLAEDLSPEDIQDWELVTSRLAAEQPLWEPGTAHAYHPITHGWLIGEVLRRITGLGPGDLLTRELTEPLSVEAWIGVPESVRARVAYLTMEPPTPELVRSFEEARPGPAPSWVQRTATLGGALPPALIGETSGFNDPAIRAAQIPGAGGIATAPAMAAIWSSTVVATNGFRSLEDSTRARATLVQSEGPSVDAAPPPYARWAMGFQLDSPARRYLTASSFGHDGAGGQVMFADPGLKVGFAFLTNLMLPLGDARATSLIDALRACLDENPR
ncbi:MAG TPA: serine hydrolase domain-containing protein [Microbacterium sp.]|uniref:serine hydrolase domain-containing protein n=1 Tax=Microbacterium sp. TaxID=51671 RepID=UPI002CEFF681|nr:serine hydrolase domain-containing protein [Microbacterium sp.]HWI31990.1 serine hydrolase domain-containing protein [Microbacterium sp.]